MATKQTETWDLWYSKAAATGLPFARGRVAAGNSVMLVHAAPPVLTVMVRDGQEHPVASGKDLTLTDETPIARLTRQGDRIERTDIWPGPGELGQLVLLPGGEVGVLKSWWHADDQREWRWQIELYNHK
ncbi:MAG: hypothetical protein DYG89_40020 [Caldilinea sp. CFX5]|nr:hypothetical protein [Caldilinea sp. CFX5]